MRRIIIGAALVAATVFVPVGSASAHVHGITPLLRCGNELDGADRTDTTPAAAANGGPIVGLIPRDVGHAPLDIGDGGFNAPACDGNP